MSRTRPPEAALRSAILLAVAAAGLAAVTAAGCHTMTTAKQAQLEEEAKRKKEDEEKKAKAEAEQKRLEAEREEMKKKLLEMRLAEKRESLYADAQNALAGGEAARALEILGKIFKPDPLPKLNPDTQEPEVDKESGKPLLVEAPDVPIEPKVEARIRYTEGLALFELDRKTEAIAAFERAVGLDPEWREARRNLGKILFMERKYAEALKAWEKELSAGYRDGDLLFLIGQAQWEVGSAQKNPIYVEAARLAMQAVLVEKPNDVEVQRWLSILEFETGRYAEAIRLFEAVRRVRPLDPEYLELLANSYVKVGDNQNAIDCLELAARIKPPSAAAARMLGDLHAAVGLDGRAAEWLVRAAGGSPKQAPADERYNIGLLFANAGRNEEAIEWLGSIRPDEKHRAAAQSQLAHLLKDLGRSEEAVEAFESAHEAEPGDGRALIAAGDIYLAEKKLDKARDCFARAAALKDTKADGFAGLADVAYEKGDLEEAVLSYKKAIEASPGDPRFEGILRQVEEELRLKREIEGEGASGGQ
jgi:tetratricopeptide (TPR) repeat protein